MAEATFLTCITTEVYNYNLLAIIYNYTNKGVWLGALTGVTAEGRYKHTKKIMHVYLQVQMCGESAKELHSHSVAYYY